MRTIVPNVVIFNYSRKKMKKFPLSVLFIAGFLLACNGIRAQEYHFGFAGASAVSVQYHRPPGLYAGYVFPFKQERKLIVDFAVNYSYQSYNVINISHVLGSSFDVRKVKPQNWWFSLSSSFNFRVFSGSCLIIRMGPLVSLNYFICKEQVHEIPTETQPDRTYQDKNNYLNRPGLGGNIEAEFKGLLKKNISIIASCTPQVIAYGNFFPKDVTVEGSILAITSHLGLRYRIY